MTPLGRAFRTELRAALTDWPMDDPATVWVACRGCDRESLCQPVLCQAGVRGNRVVTELRFLCRPCTRPR